MSKMIKTSKFDAADYLKTPEQIAAYLTEALAQDSGACFSIEHRGN